MMTTHKMCGSQLEHTSSLRNVEVFCRNVCFNYTATSKSGRNFYMEDYRKAWNL